VGKDAYKQAIHNELWSFITYSTCVWKSYARLARHGSFSPYTFWL